MTAAPLLIAWAIMCSTYLYFRGALQRQQLETVKEAQHPLQPGLAIWGIVWSIAIGMLLIIESIEF
jgi:amino acid permease